MATYRYKDSQLSTRSVSDLLRRMTLPVASFVYKGRSSDSYRSILPNGDRCKSNAQVGIGQITRPLGTHPVHPKEGARVLNALQTFLFEETRPNSNRKIPSWIV
jgi:hypothetical protein